MHLHSIRVANIKWLYVLNILEAYILILDPKCLMYFSAELSETLQHWYTGAKM